jgi:hypothetical protein
MFLFYKNIQTVFGAHLASYSMDPGILSRGQSGQGVNLTTHIHLAPRLRTSGNIHPLPLYAFMALTGKTLSFYHDKHYLLIRPKGWRYTGYHKLMHTVKLLL